MHAQFNRFELENFARSAADAFLQGDSDLNDTITKIARENDFTPHHVERVVQNANIFVNGALVNKAREGGEDPRVTFPMAKSAAVMDRLHNEHHKLAADERKADEVRGLFLVEKQAHDVDAVVSATVGKMAPDPYAQGPRSVDHMKLASDMLSGGVDVSAMTSASIDLACQTLEALENRAVSDHSLAKEAMDMAEMDLANEISEQLLSGMATATMRDVVKQAGLSDAVSKAVNSIITKTAARLGLCEGASLFLDRAVVNQDHPLIKKASKIEVVIDNCVRKHTGLNKIAEARKTARREYARAVREGR